LFNSAAFGGFEGERGPLRERPLSRSDLTLSSLMAGANRWYSYVYHRFVLLQIASAECELTQP
jgi:hypothetical protein